MAERDGRAVARGSPSIPTRADSSQPPQIVARASRAGWSARYGCAGFALCAAGCHHAILAAAAPIIPVSRPSFFRVPPGMRAIHPQTWHLCGQSAVPYRALVCFRKSALSQAAVKRLGEYPWHDLAAGARVRVHLTRRNGGGSGAAVTVSALVLERNSRRSACVVAVLSSAAQRPSCDNSGNWFHSVRHKQAELRPHTLLFGINDHNLKETSSIGTHCARAARPIAGIHVHKQRRVQALVSALHGLRLRGRARGEHKTQTHA